MSVLSGKRRNIDDVTASPTFHYRDRVVASIENAKQIRFDDLLKLLAREFFDRLAKDADPGIIHEDIESPVDAFAFGHHLSHLFFAAHIAHLAADVALR